MVSAAISGAYGDTYTGLPKIVSGVFSFTDGCHIYCPSPDLILRKTVPQKKQDRYLIYTASDWALRQSVFYQNQTVQWHTKDTIAELSTKNTREPVYEIKAAANDGRLLLCSCVMSYKLLVYSSPLTALAHL